MPIQPTVTGFLPQTPVFGTPGIISVRRGDDIKIRIALKQEDQITAIDLTTSPEKIWFTVKAKVSDIDSNAILTKSLGGGITIMNDPNLPVAPTDGMIEIALVPGDTNDSSKFANGVRYPCDVQLKLNGEIKTPWIGAFIVYDDVTNAIT